MRQLEGIPGGNGGAYGRNPMDADAISGAVIGQKIRVNGSIEGDADLRVDGHVEGSVRLSETLRVEQGGSVAAEIEARATVVRGMVRGNIQASEVVRITATGRMMGDISAPRVIIEEGAAFRGRIDMDWSEAADSPVDEPDVPLPLASGA